MKIAIGVLCAAWLLVGAYAAQQRHYFGPEGLTCDRAATVAATVVTGPLNYNGADPVLRCPDPS